MPDRSKIIAVVNQKGGVGKTTTTINLGAALSALGRRVVIIDLDPQGNASTGLGIEADQRAATTYDLLLDGRPLAECSLATKIPGLMIVPATSDLASADFEMSKNPRRTLLLRDALQDEAVAETTATDILIDCPPSLSLLTVNAMVAAHSVLVPLQSEFFALEGLSQLMLSLREVRSSVNPELSIEGVLLTMFDGRNRLAQQVLADARDTLGDLVYDTIIPRNVRVSEAPSFAQPVTEYDPASKGAVAYHNLAREYLERNKQRETVDG